VEDVDGLLARAGVDPAARPETLEVERFADLVRAVHGAPPA
jgi:16S rRNA A1518/A1519 N6-dimethyltransferase RsmA/KsgA/DIM1 with predicted DNA glycosylase/AP lyase activity